MNIDEKWQHGELIQEEISNNKKIFENRNINFLSLDQNNNRPSYTFRRCNFKGIHLNLIVKVKGCRIRFIECIFEDEPIIDSLNNITIVFQKCNFEFENFNISADLSDGRISFSSCFINSLTLNDSKNLDKMIFNNCVINYLAFTSNTGKDLLIGGSNTIINKLEAVSLNFNTFLLSDVYVSNLDMSFSVFNRLLIQSSEKEHLEVRVNNIILYANEIIELIFSNYTNNETFKVYSNQIKDSLIFQNSTFRQEVEFFGQKLDSAKFIGVDFSKSKLSFESVDLSNTLFYNVIWPKNYLLQPNYNDLGKSESEENQLRSISEQYRQLKLKALQGGDKIGNLRFYSHEMEINQYLAKNQGKDQFWDWLLLFTNKHFSNFGLSYIRPIKWLISIHTFMFFLFILSGYDNLVFIWPWNNSLSGIGESLGHFFYLLNPLHKLPEFESGWILIVDFFSRILNSYFIYYFIKATRKFTS